MVSLIRNGSRMLYVTTDNKEAIVNFLSANYQIQKIDPRKSFDESSEYQTIIFLMDTHPDSTKDITKADSYLVFTEILTFVCSLMSSEVKNVIDKIRTGPQMIIMRSSGDLDKVTRKMQSDFGGEIVSYDRYLHDQTDDITYIALTEKPLNKPLGAADFQSGYLRLEGDFGAIKREIRMHALRYLNIGIGNRDWNEIEIRIYDKFGAYKLHYDRMIEVFDDLELGLILGESWSKDYPKALLAVEVYRVRLLTFHDPSKIKRILFAMEYLADGTRIVDYDLYVGNDKVSWNAGLKHKKRSDRYSEALAARSELYEKLSGETVDKISNLENEIVKTRY